jgi:hypothetical protein
MKIADRETERKASCSTDNRPAEKKEHVIVTRDVNIIKGPALDRMVHALLH